MPTTRSQTLVAAALALAAPVVVAAVGCHRSIGGSSGQGSSSGTGDTTTDTQDSATGQDGEQCFLFEDAFGTPAYGKMCDGLCRDVRLDPDHCGQCDNVCRRGEFSSNCLEGICGPISTECFPPEEGLTCRKVCADIGHECSQNRLEGGCTGAVWGGITAIEGFDFNDVCVEGQGRLGTVNVPEEIAGCDDPIIFDYVFDQVAAICCCRLF